MDYEVDFDNEAIVNIETKVITKKQTPETDEALMLLERAKKRVKKAFVIPFFVFLALVPVFCPFKLYGWALAFGILAVVWIIVYFIYRARILSPYYSLLNVAIKNDEIRHEERIKFRERKRLENEYDNEILVTKGQMSKIQKTKVQNIKAMEKLEEANKLNPVKETTFQVASKNRIKLNDISVGSNRPMVPTKKPE